MRVCVCEEGKKITMNPSKYETLHLFLTLHYYVENTVPLSQYHNEIAKRLQNYEIGEKPQNQHALAFLYYAIEKFLHEFYLPSVEMQTFGVANYDYKRGVNLLDEKFEKAQASFEKLLQFKHDDPQKITLLCIWLSGEMNLVVSALRRWANLALRLHYVLTYYHLHKSFPDTLLPADMPMYAEHLLPYISKWCEYVFGSFFPMKLKHNSRVVMSQDYIYQACISHDFKRLQTQPNPKAWDPFPNETNLSKFLTIATKFKTQKCDFEDKSSRKLITKTLLYHLIDENDLSGCCKFMNDLYSLGENKISHMFTKAFMERLKMLEKRGPSSKEYLKLVSLVQDVSAWTRFDHLRVFYEFITPNTMSPSCDTTTKACWNTYSAYFEYVYSESSFLGSMKRLLSKHYGYFGVSSKEVHVLWDDKVLKTVPARTMVDCCRLYAISTGDAARRICVGFLKFMAIDIKSHTSIPFETSSSIDHHLLTSNVEKLVDFTSSEPSMYMGTDLTEMYNYIIDTIEFLREFDAIDGRNECNTFIEHYKKDCSQLNDYQCKMNIISVHDPLGKILHEL